jgi:carbonic anhydrase
MGIGRRKFIRLGGFSLLTLGMGCAAREEVRPRLDVPGLALGEGRNPQFSLQRLVEGNERFVSGNLTNPRRNQARRDTLLKKQRPFAVIVSCSDSRVPPEVIFDQGLGDLFVVRTAGHGLDSAALGTIEYGLKVLGAPLVMVLGHSSCGAMQAVRSYEEGERGFDENIKALVEGLHSNLTAEVKHYNDLSELTKAHVKKSIKQLTRLHYPAAVKDGSLVVRGGFYDLQTGRVELLEP